MILPPGPFMGSAEIGDLFGVSRQRVQQIIAKRDFPAPYTELAMGKIWLAHAVRAWGVAAKRLPADAAPGPAEPAPPVQAAPQAPRRSPGVRTEQEADDFVDKLSTEDYADLRRRAKAVSGSEDYDVFSPVMRQLVIAGWRPAQ